MLIVSAVTNQGVSLCAIFQRLWSFARIAKLATLSGLLMSGFQQCTQGFISLHVPFWEISIWLSFVTSL